MTPSVFRATWQHALIVRALALELSYSVDEWRDGPKPSDEQRAIYLHQVEGWLHNPAFGVIVATCSGVPAGFIALSREVIAGGADLRCVKINGFYIRPMFRDGSVRAALDKAAEEACLSEATECVQVMVRSKHDPILKLAERRGFRQVAVVLQKDLGHERRNQRAATDQEIYQDGCGRAKAGAV